MSAWIRWAASLYPAAWRRRYGAEFATLLEDIDPGWRDFFDVLRGAILMNFKMPAGGKIVVATAVAGLAVAAWFAIRSTDQYVSTAVMQCPAGEVDEIQDRLNSAQQRALSRTSLTQILMREDIYRQERQTQPLEKIVGNMRNRAISIGVVDTAANRPPAFTVQFEYPDRYKAQAVARDLTSALSEGMSENNGPQLQVLDPPTLPSAPVAPRRSRIVIMGLIAGVLAGILLLGVRRWPLVAACGVTAAVLVYGGSLLVPNRYVSTAVLMTPDQDSARQLEGAMLDDAYLRTLIERLNLYPGMRAKEPLNRVVEEMRNRDVRVSAIEIPRRQPGSRGERHAIVISYSSDASRFAVHAVTTELVAHAIELNLRLQTQNVATVVDPASLPEAPVAPNRTVLALLGLVGGMLLGTAWVLIRRSRSAQPA